MSYSNWTDKEDARLLELQKRGIHVEEMSLILGRSVYSIRQRLYKKRSKKNPLVKKRQFVKAENGKFWQQAKAKLYGRLTIKNGVYYCDGHYVTLKEIAYLAGIELPGNGR